MGVCQIYYLTGFYIYKGSSFYNYFSYRFLYRSNFNSPNYILVSLVRAHSARITGRRKLIRVVLDNGESVECTDDHLFMMRDGTYKEAGKLQPKDSLMPLYRREWKETDSNYLKGYEFVQMTNPETGRRRWYPTHIVVRNAIGLKDGSEKTVCHHKNYNRRDNRPDNLEMMTWEQHKKEHGEIGRANLLKLWQNEEFLAYRNSEEYRQKQSNVITESWQKPEVKEAHMRGIQKRIAREGAYPEAFRKWNHSEANIEHLRSMSDNKEINRQKSEGAKKFWDSAEGDALRERRKSQNLKTNHKRWHEDRNIIKDDCPLCCPNNHKVVRIEDTGKIEYVYDLTVEEHHNFALSSGVFVHNCHSGTMDRGGIQRKSNPHEWQPRFLAPPVDIRVRSAGRDLEMHKIGRRGANIKSSDNVCVLNQRHLLLSGCRDDQTSADAFVGGKWGGALSQNFIRILKNNKDKSWKEIHGMVVDDLNKQGYSQIPQLTGPDNILSKAPLV